MDVPEQITCVDCGQLAHRLSYPPEEGWEVGDYVAYRCSGCNDRWDMEVSSDIESGESSTNFSYSAEARSILEARKDSKDN